MITDTLIFLFVYYISFLSVYSYGRLIKDNLFCINKKSHYEINEYSNLFYGTSFLLIIGFIYYFSGIKNPSINIFIILFGLLIFIKKKKPRDLLFYIIPIALFTGIIIYKNHNDFHLYHFQYLIELTDNTSKIGMGNLNPKYIYSSLLSYAEVIFQFQKYNYHFINIPRFLLYVSICGYLTLNISKMDSYLFLKSNEVTDLFKFT